jgi:Bacterial EndoU nuclease
MKDYCYYIIPNTITSEKNSLSPGDRIVALPTSWPMSLHPIKAEGPFLSLHYLIKLSKFYADLQKKNSSRAHKIVKKEYIIVAEDYVLTKKGETFEFDFVDAIDHSIKGCHTKEKLSGIHFYNDKNTKIVEELETNDKGVWTAIIEKVNKNGEWIRKHRSTTFFPKDWTAAKTIAEIIYAEKNKIQRTGEVNIFDSNTRCGIKIEIITKNGKIKTVYPII